MAQYSQATKIIVNPPYDGNLHLKVVQEAMKHSDDVVNLSPIRWLQDPLAEEKKGSDWNKFKNVRAHISELEVVSLDEMAKFFDGVAVKAGIYYLTKDGGFNIDNIRCAFLVKLHKKHYDVMKDHLDVNKLDGWRVRCGNYAMFKGSTRLQSESVKFSRQSYVHFKLDRIYKDGYTEDGIFWTADRLPGAGNIIKPIGTPIPSSVKFSSKEEAYNFVASTRLKLLKYICGLCFDYGCSSDYFMPYLGDYTHPWDDAALYKYFGLTQEEISLIEEEMK